MADDPAQRLRDALELADLAERMVRARIIRERPELDADAVEVAVLEWLQEPRGPLDGDADGQRIELDLAR